MAELLNFDRLEAIKPLVEIHTVQRDRQFPRLLPDGSRAWSTKDVVDWCATRVGRNPRTIRYWIARFKAAGKSAFDPAPRADKGTSRFFARHRKAAILAAYLYLCLRPSVRVVHEAIVRNCELIGVPEAKLPSCQTVRAWLRSASPTLVALALEGQRTYQDLMFSDLDRGLLAARKDRGE